MAGLSVYNGLLRDSSSAVVTSSHESSFDSCGRTITAAVQRLNWTPVLSSYIKDQFRVDSHNSSFIWTLNRRAVGGFVCGGHLSISVERHHLGILKNKEEAFVNPRMFRCVCVLEENLASDQISGSAACVSALSMTRATADLTCDRTWTHRCAQSLQRGLAVKNKPLLYIRNQKHFIFYIYIYSFLNILVWDNNMNWELRI